MNPESGHCIPGSDAASASHALPTGAGSPGPTKPTVEIKSDRKCRETGNLFIEYRQKGRPSGIATTEADYWAFEYEDNCWLIIPTDRLRAIAREIYRTDPFSRMRGGDFNRYEGVLVPINRLLPEAAQS